MLTSLLIVDVWIKFGIVFISNNLACLPVYNNKSTLNKTQRLLEEVCQQGSNAGKVAWLSERIIGL